MYKDYDLNQLYREGDYDQLYLCSENLIRCIISKFHNIAIDEEDFIDLGYIAFMKTVKTFDPDKNIKFSSLLYTILTNELLQEARKVRNKAKYGYKILSIQDNIKTSVKEPIGFEEVLASDIDIEGTYIKQELVDICLKLAKELGTDLQYQALLLYLDGKPYRTISKELGFSYTYSRKLIKTLFNKIIDKLKTLGYC